ncbi:MAG: DUF5803 family protein [Methanosarcinaceae archaeon]|nr:DUF5803 family protein [Methanosarcinaceae archaeon]
MRYATILALLILILSTLTAGCIDELVPIGDNSTNSDISVYEFDVFVNQSANSDIVANTTTFYLSKDESTRVVHMLINATVIDIIPIDDMSSNQDSLDNIVIIADSVNTNTTSASVEVFNSYSLASEVSDVGYTISKEVIRGQKHTYLKFNETITGFVAYTLPAQKGQDFIYIQSSPSTVRFVLPVGYTTGNQLIGIARPQPDETYVDNEGRETLIWYGNEDMPKSFNVKYYPPSAPKTLLIVGIILAFGAAIVLADYYVTRKNLKKMRDDIEQSSKMGASRNKDRNKDRRKK